jgi:hypothetical protein
MARSMDSLDIPHPLVQKAVEFLRVYQPQLLFLYGSFAANNPTATSDIDMLCFADQPEFVHDSTLIDGHALDAWIYPMSKLQDIAEFSFILPCKVLLDEKHIAETLLAKLRSERDKSSVMTTREREQYLRWLEKMLVRASGDTAEANYRYHWLLFEFPESYRRLRGEYFDGPVKTMHLMSQLNPELFRRYETLLAGEKSVSQLACLYAEIKTPV